MIDDFSIPQNDRNADWIKYSDPKATHEDRRAGRLATEQLQKERLERERLERRAKNIKGGQE